MSEKLTLLLLDISNNLLKEKQVQRPKLFDELLYIIHNNFKIIRENYNIFYLSENYEEKMIYNDKQYQLSNDIIYIKEINLELFEKSAYENIYDKLSESKNDILDEKYNCYICSENIKKEKPYFCYKCQKIFHKNCLKDWDKKRKAQNDELICPNCRNELSLEEWKLKLDYEENRKNEVEKIEKINEYKLYYNLFININKIKDKKIKEIEKEKNEIIEGYKIYLKNITNKLNEINSKIGVNKLNFENYNTKDAINEIIHNLDIIKNHIYPSHALNEKIKVDEIKSEERKEKFEFKNEINLIYFADNYKEENIFGSTFVKINNKNIDLIINGERKNLISTYKLKTGENKITLIIKNKLTNLSYMFYECFSLKNFEELKYLNTENVYDFSYIFSAGSAGEYLVNKKDHHFFSDIDPLKTWNVSKGVNFEKLFDHCENLSNIEALKNWDVSNGTNFSNMFSGCQSLSDISPLEKWNVSNGIYFKGLFSWCYSLSDITALKNWNVSNCTSVSWMFLRCENISDIKALENWNVSKCKSFLSMFDGCIKLSNIEPLKNWNVSNGEDFSKMFYKCKILNLNILKNWNLSEKTKNDMIKYDEDSF